MDATKAIAAATFYKGDSWDLYSDKKADIVKALPVITIPTLAATGSEMNTSSVISNVEIHEKHGRKHNLLLPKVSFLDPTNTYTVSAYQTAAGSADIFGHIIEKFYFSSQQKLQMLDEVIESLLRTVIKYAPIAIKEPTNYEARANLMWASTWALNGFLSNGVTQVLPAHAIEHQLSAFYDITHGHGVAILIPRWLSYILNEHTAPQIYRLGRNVFGVKSGLDAIKGAKKTIEAISNFFFVELGLPATLTELGIDDTNFEAMAKNTCGNGILKGFVDLSAEDVVKIYRLCL